jgi:hypothetical protein
MENKKVGYHSRVMDWCSILGGYRLLLIEAKIGDCCESWKTMG